MFLAFAAPFLLYGGRLAGVYLLTVTQKALLLLRVVFIVEA